MEKIAIISTRLGGIDGVSIEADKWAGAYKKIGFDPVYIAGKFGRKDRSRFFKVEEMDYYHPDVVNIRKIAFNEEKKASGKDLGRLIDNITGVKERIKKKLLAILDDKRISFLSIENALTIPLNIPIGVALTEIISENNIKAVTRHHDFYWERKQFLCSNVEKMLDDYFPPDLVNLKHVVINTLARKSIYDKKKIKATYIPNIFDFAVVEEIGNNYREVKKFLNMDDGDFLILQPTRLIARKNIERTIDLVEKLSKKTDKKINLVISGKPEKNELDYFNEIIRLARKSGISLILSENDHGHIPEYTRRDLFEKFDIYDLYKACDLVTLPSDIEGFGNPVIEASVLRKPLFVNNYPVLTDMLSKGFEFIVIDKKVDKESVERTLELLTGHKLRKRIADKNFKIAKEYYSISYLISRLEKLMGEFT
ncbi:Mannosylglucosylglycerate synthase [subsurface metagenome]